jgi:hypothetical protein
MSLINNHKFQIYVLMICPDELEIKDTTEFDKSAPYLDILLNIDFNSRLTTNVMILTLQSSYFLFNAVIYHFRLLMLCIFSNRTCFAYEDFSKRDKQLTNSWWCKVIMNLVLSHHFANSTVILMTLFATGPYTHTLCYLLESGLNRSSTFPCVS